jgi:hypothetical protein
MAGLAGSRFKFDEVGEIVNRPAPDAFIGVEK